MQKLQKKIFRARAPLRVSLAGGGTDIKAYFNTNKGAVLNFTISKYAYAEVKIIESLFIAKAIDLDIEVKVNISEHKNKNINGENLFLHWQTYKYMMGKHNNSQLLPAEISTYCDAPIGSGLGSSSTLVVCMVKIWSEILNAGLDEYQIAEAAYEIERNICKLEGGMQDHYSAAFGGVNFIEFENSKVVVHPLRIKNCFKSELESSLVLHYCGSSRDSSNIIRDQIKVTLDNNNDRIKFLHKLKEIAYEMKTHFLKGSISKIIELMNLGWSNKKETSQKINNKNIQERIDLAFKFGAKSAKVSGAGGGGFITFLVPPKQSIIVRNELNKFGTETFLATITENGAECWVSY